MTETLKIVNRVYDRYITRPQFEDEIEQLGEMAADLDLQAAESKSGVERHYLQTQARIVRDVQEDALLHPYIVRSETRPWFADPEIAARLERGETVQLGKRKSNVDLDGRRYAEAMRITWLEWAEFAAWIVAYVVGVVGVVMGLHYVATHPTLLSVGAALAVTAAFAWVYWKRRGVE